jgi:hypothetical protein
LVAVDEIELEEYAFVGDGAFDCPRGVGERREI